MKKNYIKLVVAIELLGIAIQGLAFYDARGADTVSIERPEATEKAEDIRLRVNGAGKESEIAFSVEAKRPTEEEVKKLFEKAKSEIDESFLGENRFADQVWRRLSLDSEYADGLVEASWDFEPGGIVDGAGNIDYRGFDESEIITASCTLEAYDRVEEYSFPFVVVRPDINTGEGFSYAVNEAVEEANEDNAGERLTLPAEVSGVKLSWQRPVEYTGLLLCVLGAVAGAALYLGSGVDEKKEVQRRREEFGRQYSDIVENLGLYVGAGISVRGAFERMEHQYLRWQAKHPGESKASYENLILMNRAIHDGRLEADAYESYGIACMHPAYRKLSILLRQNLKRGNDKLLEELSHEEQMVSDARRREIKSAGELISTKLLIPMGGLLMMILIVLIVPALQSIRL